MYQIIKNQPKNYFKSLGTYWYFRRSSIQTGVTENRCFWFPEGETKVSTRLTLRMSVFSSVSLSVAAPPRVDATATVVNIVAHISWTRPTGCGDAFTESLGCWQKQTYTLALSTITCRHLNKYKMFKC